MERSFRWLRVPLLLLCLAAIGAEAQAEYAATVSIKPTSGRWKDTLLAGETNILEISITNETRIAGYAIPLRVTSALGGAFARLSPDTANNLDYVGRMINAGNPFTQRIVNLSFLNGITPDSILYGAVEFGSNYLTTGTGIVIEHLMTIDPYVGSVRIDTGLFPPSNVLGFSDTVGNDIAGVNFHPALPVFPVVLRIPNNGPSCTPPANISSHFGVPLNAVVIGSDPEGNALTFRQISGPGTTTGAGAWSWTPSCANVGVNQVCVTVSDPNHLDWDTCCFQVTVTQDPPTLNCTNQSVHYGDTLSYFLPGSDDGCPQALKYFKISGPGAVNQTTGEFRYMPLCADVGTYFVEAVVTDGKDTVECQFQVTVTNSPPIITCPADFFVGIGDTVDFQIPANDPDGDPITYTLLNFQKLSGPTPGGPNTPPTLSPSGAFFWPTSNANDDDFGVWEVSLRVDEPCDSAFCTFHIEVTPNRSPVCQSPPEDVLSQWGVLVTGQFNLFDPDGDSISFQQISGPGSLDSTGLWSWLPGCADVGTYEVCVMVADSAFPGGDTCCFSVTIFQLPPALTCADDSIHAGSGPLVIDLGAVDDGCPGNPVRFYKISGAGTLDSVTGVYTLSDDRCTDIGNHFVTVYATDGVLADTCTFNARIYNNAPRFLCPDSIVNHTNDRTFTLATSLLDPDGDAIINVSILSFVKQSGPPGGPNSAPTVDLAGLVTWQTDSSNNLDLGLWRMILRASDSCGQSRCTLFIQVYPNRPPTCVTADVSGHVGELVKRAVFGQDADGDYLMYEQISGPGSIDTVLGNALWSWVPNCEERGEYDVCITVSDSVFSGADTCCFHVTIFENPPVVNCSTQTVHYGVTLEYDIAYVDDGCPKAGIWSLLSGPGTLDTITGHYSLPTSCGDLGSVNVTVALNDSLRADTCTFAVNITNTPPFVTCPADTSVKVGVTIDIDIPFGDVDGDPTTIALVGLQKLGGINANPPNNPPTINASGHLNWVTDNSNFDDVATWELTVRVTELCDSSFCTFRIEIAPNNPPECSAPNDTDATCLSLISRTFGKFDADNDPVTFTQISGPGSVNPTTGVWSWNAPCDSGGNWQVCVTVSDFLYPEADTCCFTLTLCAVPTPGDVNGDNTANAADIITIVNFVFKSGVMPYGAYTADMNCDGVTNSQDIIYLVNFVFKGGPPPCYACDSPLFPTF
jgi:hypothetical protein